MEKTFLQAQIKKTKNLKERIRLCAVLAAENGYPVKTIASILRLSESTVYEYLTQQDKIPQGKTYQGRKCKLSEEQETELAMYLTQSPCLSLKQLTNHIEEKYGKKMSLWLKESICEALKKGHTISEIASILQISPQLAKEYSIGSPICDLE